MTRRNFVVRERIHNPNRNAGKHSDKREKVLSTATMKEFAMPEQKPEIDLLAEVKATIHVMLDAINELAPDEGYEEFFAYGTAIKRAKSLLKLLKAHEEEAIMIAARHVQHAQELEDFDPITTQLALTK